MNDTRRFALLAVTIMMTVVLPFFAQDQSNGQAQPAITGSGSPGHIAVWKSSTALGNSGIVANGGSIGIGTKTPAATLEVNGNAQVDGNLSLSGSVLLAGMGQLIWASNNGSANFSAGLDALPATTTGAENTAIGSFAMSVGTSGAANTAIGYQALASNTNGWFNTAVGLQALAGNSTGGYNTATGVEALANNTNGGGNTANGFRAMDANSIGSQNTAIGSSSLASNTTGGVNTAIGNSALSNNITGSNNIGIGYVAGFNVTTTSNNIHIGNEGSATDGGTVRIGTSGIQTSVYIAGIYGSSTGLANVPVVVDSNGNLGTVQSSRRYKEAINDMGDASNGLMQLRPVTFHYKKAYEDGSKPIQYGLIAEEVAEVYPDLIARSADGQVESVRYQLLDPMLLNELQKQHATIAAQKEHIQSLEERLARVEAMLAAGATGATGHSTFVERRIT